MAKGVTIDFNANLTRFTNSVDKATDQLNKFEKNANRISKNISRAFKGLAAALPVAAIGVAVSRIADSADNIQKLSIRLGASTEALSELRFAAEQSGVTFETLTMGLQRMTRRVAEAAQGTGEAKNALLELGLSAQELSRLAPEDQFEAIADAINELGSDSDRVRLAMKLFDSEGVSLIQTMENGAIAIREAREEARRLGLSLSQEQADQAARFNEEWGRLSATFEGAAQSIALELVPVLTELAENLRTNVAPAIREVLEFFDLIEPKAVKMREVERELSAVAKGIEATQAAISLQEETGNVQAVEALNTSLKNQQQVLEELQAELDIYTGKKTKAFAADAPEIRIPSQTLEQINARPRRSSGKSAAAIEAEQFARALQALRDELDPVGAKTRAYLEDVALLDRAWKEGQISGEQYELLLAQLAVDTEALAEAERQLASDRQKAIGLIKDLDPGSGIRDQIIEVQRLRDIFPELSDALADVELELQSKWDDIGSQAEEAAKDTKDAWEALGPTFTSAFEDAVVEGEKLSDVLKGIEQDIIRIATRNLITEPIGGAISEFFSASGTGGGFLSSLFGGFRASGGPVSLGKSYLVGENGPELFTPRTSGQVLPSGSGNTYNFSFAIPSDNLNHRRTAEQVAREAARMMSTAQGAV